MRAKKTKILLTLAVALSVLGGGGLLLTSSNAIEPGYRSVVAKRERLNVSVLSTGVVQAENRVGVESSISGRAEKVLVQNGDHVVQGQNLMWISSIERAAVIDAARVAGSGEVAKWEELYQLGAIVAPITGTIILRSIEPGQNFTYSDKLFVIADHLIVQAQVDETDIARIRKSQMTKIVLDAYPDQPIAGRVKQIAYEAKTVNNVTTYEVIVVPDRVPDFMRSGMTANVTFDVLTKDNALVVPTEAVKVKNDSLIVLVQAKDPAEAPEERQVKTGVTDGKRVEILSGLEEGEIALIPRSHVTKGPAASGTNPFGSMGGPRSR